MNDILFIDSSDSFVIKSIIRNLESLGLRCAVSEWSAEDIKANINDVSDIVIGNIDDIEDIKEESVELIKEFVACGKKFCLMGQQDDIDEYKSKYSADDIYDSFCRPINAEDVAEKTALMTNRSISIKKHILVVDDSGIMLNTLQDLLGTKYKISVANSAMNAEKFLSKAEKKPDLILLDYAMPVCSGAQFFETLRRNIITADIPVIFLTGKDDPATVQSVLALKPDGYLLKNMPKNFIVKRIEEFFDKRK